MRFELHHALAAQLQQGLAHRRDADAELGRGLVEPDEGARPLRFLGKGLTWGELHGRVRALADALSRRGSASATG
ncbi:hypothetical protein PICSAR26_04637 [Mycobacterium avium subsp. paratuberculosis]|nr:hypothetical protein PICSAR26_04637 [Mycobacterium avium subsp. paratuberculosis]